MLKNILIYSAILIGSFIFCIFYYAWFSWYLFLVIVCLPILSLIVSLPFMIYAAIIGFSASCNDYVYKNQTVKISVGGKNNKSIFLPFIKIKFKTDNSFSESKSKIIFKYAGLLKRGAVASNNKVSKNCGNIEITAKYGKIYDFTGIFFIPVRLNFNLEVLVIPKPSAPKLLPQTENAAIVGYKPKPGGGFSDFYELRQYQNGDSLKNIHWKLSSKHDDLIVREPSEPIYSRFVLKTAFGQTPQENDTVLARFIYISNLFIENETPFFALDGQSGTFLSIKSKKDIYMFLRSVFTSENSISNAENLNDCVIYTIHPDFEEVSKL